MEWTERERGREGGGRGRWSKGPKVARQIRKYRIERSMESLSKQGQVLDLWTTSVFLSFCSDSKLVGLGLAAELLVLCRLGLLYREACELIV